MFCADVSAVAEAAEALGWSGAPVPVRVAGEDAWAIATLDDDADAQGFPVSIAGVVITGTPGSRPVQRASVFAGYCARAVLVPDGRGVLSLQVEAAVLGQGMVVSGDQGMLKLSDPGPALPGIGEFAWAARQALAEQVYVQLNGGEGNDVSLG